ARAMGTFARFFEMVDAFTAVGEDLLQEAIEIFPCLSAKGHVIPNGLPEEWFTDEPSIPGREEPALFVGRLEHIKGVDVLLEAWRQVHHRLRWRQLLIAGDGGEANALQRRSAELGLSDSVLFLGRKSACELRRLYQNAGIVVLPSRQEG